MDEPCSHQSVQSWIGLDGQPTLAMHIFKRMTSTAQRNLALWPCPVWNDGTKSLRACSKKLVRQRSKSGEFRSIKINKPDHIKMWLLMGSFLCIAVIMLSIAVP